VKSTFVSVACTLASTKPRKAFPGAGAVVEANSRGVAAMISVVAGVESVDLISLVSENQSNIRLGYSDILRSTMGMEIQQIRQSALCGTSTE